MSSTFSTPVPGQFQTGPAAPIPFGPGPGSIAYMALRKSGQIRAGQTANSDILADCLTECNTMIDSLNALQNFQYYIDDRYFAINVSQQTYTLGPSGTFRTDINNTSLLYRPNKILAANLVLETNVATPTRIPIRIIHVDEWAQIPVIAVPSQVTIEMYVSPTFPNVTLNMFPFPQTGNQIEFFMWPGFPQFSSVNSVFAGPSGWRDALVSNLAYRLFSLNDKNMGAASRVRAIELERAASQSYRLIEGVNAPDVVLTPDLIVDMGSGGRGAPFDYLSGYFSE